MKNKNKTKERKNRKHYKFLKFKAKPISSPFMINCSHLVNETIHLKAPEVNERQIIMFWVSLAVILICAWEARCNGRVQLFEQFLHPTLLSRPSSCCFPAESWAIGRPSYSCRTAGSIPFRCKHFLGAPSWQFLFFHQPLSRKNAQYLKLPLWGNGAAFYKRTLNKGCETPPA